MDTGASGCEREKKDMEKKESEILTREQRIFGDYPVPKAVASMVILTIISQIITMVRSSCGSCALRFLSIRFCL